MPKVDESLESMKARVVDFLMTRLREGDSYADSLTISEGANVNINHVFHVMGELAKSDEIEADYVEIWGVRHVFALRLKASPSKYDERFCSSRRMNRLDIERARRVAKKR